MWGGGNPLNPEQFNLFSSLASAHPAESVEENVTNYEVVATENERDRA